MTASRKHILLVDDDAAIVNVLSQTLKELGYRVTGYTSSRKALQAFTEQPSAFDLLITDQVMPDLTGLQLAQAVMTVRADLPILLISGYVETRIVVELRERRMHAFLAKPHGVEELKTAVEALLGKQVPPS
jgi:DNA-binding NtrC family response regulator